MDQWHPPLVWPRRRLTDLERAEAARHGGLARIVSLACPVPLDEDERYSVALWSICRAVPMYDPARGVPITTYLARTIRSDLVKEAIRQRLIRVPHYLYESSGPKRPDCVRAAVAARSVSSIEAARFRGDWLEPAAEGRAEDTDDVVRLVEAIGRLQEPLRRVVELRLQGKTLRETGRCVGLTGRGVRLREWHAHAMLRSLMAGRPILRQWTSKKRG